MPYKLAAAAFFHAAALAFLASGCGLAPRPTGLVNTNSPAPAATPAPATATATTDTGQRPNLCVEGLQSPLPPPAGHVNDFAGVLDRETARRLEERLARFKERAGIEMSVVTVETTGGNDIFDYSLAVACGWGVGAGGGDGGGLLLLVAVQDRRWRIQVSRQLEADLPDAETAEIGALMRPHFAAGNYGPGLEAAANGIIHRLAEKRGL